jgi:hypothetical protein
MFVTNIKYNSAIVRDDAVLHLCKAMLMCHPETYTPAVQEIEARVGWTQDNAFAFTYALKGDLMRLRIPLPQPALRADRLWQHTCFEAFVSVKGKPEYYECNFAPSGEWAAYSFQRYRIGTPFEADKLAPRIEVRNTVNRLDLDAIVRLDHLPAILPHARLQLALCAVIEDENGTLSYWALKHAPGKPDFHHPDGFTLDFEPSDVDTSNHPLYTDKR